MSFQKSNKIKLFFIIMDLRIGGAERALLNLIRKLDKNKYEITLFLIRNNIQYNTEISKDFKIITGVEGKGSLYKNFHFLIFKLLKSAFKSDIIIGSLEYWPTFFSVLIAKILRKKTIAWIHTNLVKHLEKQRFYIKYFSKLCYKYTDCTILVSQNSLDSFEKNFVSNKRQLIYNIIDFNLIQSMSDLPLDNSKYRDNNYIIGIGRLEYPKDFETLIRAYANLYSEKICKEKFLIFGDGQDYDKLEKLICELGLLNQVFLMGFDSNVFRYLKHAKLFVMASYFEGLPLVLAEAMFLKVPIMAAYKTKNSPFSEILLNGKCGIVLEEYDEKSLTKKLEEAINLSNMERESYIESGLIRIHEFKEEFILAKWEKIFQELN
ncbi:glycosyltransferase [Fluviispira multicolorata]|uniref:Glycosyltransferase n=1 Tax=Fluviispira multicolorata TaxID=2654512 RepID=A0A833JCP9_9BACT|nr:glycosyltransferase [Fluviispira multicolorata]KAB8030853.1 glycosyltransferase [Fluviispira multicolorata]